MKENNRHARETGLINKEKIGIKNRKPVYQYTLKGIFINKYGCSSEAALSLCRDEKDKLLIRSACLNQSRLWDFIFSYESPEKRGILEYDKKSSRKVYQYDLENNFIREYPSTREASILLKGASSCSIRNACVGRSKTSFNYKWSYDEPGEVCLK